MKTINLIFLVCLFGVCSNAQNTITKVYGEVQDDINRSYKIIQLQDTSFLFGGEWNEEAFLYKTNCDGDILQSQFYGSQIGGTSRIVDFLENLEGNFIVTGECTNCVSGDTARHIFLMEVDTNLQVNTTIGIKKHKAYYYSPNPILNTLFCNPCLEQSGSDYYLVAVKPQAFTDFYLMKLNEVLDTLWLKSFDSCDPGACVDAPRSITITGDGLAVLIFNALTDSTTVWHFDFDGNTLWKKRYFNDFIRERKIVYYPPDKLIVGGGTRETTGTNTDMHLLLLDTGNGAILDEFIDGDTLNDEIVDMRLLNDGGIIVGATFNQPNAFGLYQTSRIYHLSVNPFSIIGGYDLVPNPNVITNMGVRSVLPLNDDGTEFVSVGIRGFYNRTFFHTINTCSDLDNDNYIYSEDCDDNNPNINPSATETCNGIDDNCNSQIDEGLMVFTYYLDNDNDTYGNPDSSIDTCSNMVPIGYTVNDQDCDDNNPNINPGATETCNGIDDNCNTQIDEGLTVFTYYLDNDNDTYGNPDSSIDTCSNMVPIGYTANDQDCDDSNPNINPGATETCNGIDDNCDTQIDEGLMVFTYYLDNDNDSYGNPDSSIDTCSNMVPIGYTVDDQDCDDSNPNINPGATETCNGIDDNCNTQIDEGLTVFTYYLDNDNDTYGNPDSSIDTCSNMVPIGYTVDDQDCDDNNPNINPGATEILNNGIDEDCDGMDLMTGIENFEPEKGIKIFPNPFKNEIIISSDCNEQLHVEIINILGQSVRKEQLQMNNNGRSLSLTKLPLGTYWVKVQNENGKVLAIKQLLKIE